LTPGYLLRLGLDSGENLNSEVAWVQICGDSQSLFLD
jgi:hypothetical protein